MTGLQKLILWRMSGRGAAYDYGGLPVLIDGAYFPRYNGDINRIEQSPDYFIAGWFDSGSTGSKKYDLHVPTGAPLDTKLRFYNDKAGTSVDYWTVESRVFTSAGQFVAISVYKPIAAEIYMKLYDTGEYLIRGNKV